MRWLGFTILCLVVLGGVTSCEDEQFPDNGQAISFASLSGQLVTRGTPIDANADIPNMGVFAYYTGNGLSNNWAAQGATATPAFMNNVQVTNNSGAWSYANPVYWPVANDANVSFFAYSPYATGSNGLTVNVSTGIPTISYTAPTSCAAQPDLMVSALRNDLNKVSGSPVVSFAMNHALTSIGFKASGQGESFTTIKISGVSTSGTLTTATDGTFTWSTTAPSTNEYNAIPNLATLGSTPLDVIEANGYLMMIPQTLGTGAKLIISKDDGTDVEFDLVGHIWTAGSKVIYNIDLSSEDILIVTEILLTYNNSSSSQTFTVTSTTGSGTAKSWTADYSTDNGATWTSACPDWLTIPSSGPGGTNTIQTATVTANSGTNTEDLILKSAVPKGSSGAPYDLSTNGQSTLMNTANCYIINSPGHYQLPLVYGNAIKNSSHNIGAYIPSVTSGKSLLEFLRHDENPINDPYLYSQLDIGNVVPDNASLVWEDTLGLITNVALTPNKQNLTFEVTQANIAQGNAIVAVRNSSNVILWSWHIWVTPLVNADTPVTDEVINGTSVSYNFMQFNLGWCTFGSTSRSVMVRITQDVTLLSDTIIITQDPPISVSGGFAPYWQWGRKDPIPASQGYNSSDNTLFFGSNYSFVKGTTTATIGTSIQNPNTSYSAGTADWNSTGGGGYYNMWSANNTIDQVNDNIVIKTVYDPSPVGFTVPAPSAWTGFSTANQIGTFNAGWLLSLQNNRTTFYPAAGIRNNGTGILSSVNIGGYYCSSTPSSIIQSRIISFINSPFTALNGNATSARSTGLSVRCVLEK